MDGLERLIRNSPTRSPTMAAKDLAVSLLAQNIPASVVAATIGVEESYISQLLGDEDFVSRVEAARTVVAQEDQDYDLRLNRVEESYLDRIDDKAKFANLQQSLQAFRVLNAAKRRKDRSGFQPIVNNGTIINLTLPTHVIPKYQLNQNNEIVDVEGQTMVSATPKHLDRLLLERKPTEQQAVLAQKLEIAASERAVVVLDSVRPVNRSQQRKKLELFSAGLL